MKHPATATPLSSTTAKQQHQGSDFQTNETGLRKRKMKRVRISPKEGPTSSSKARGSVRFNNRELQERSLLLDTNEASEDDRDIDHAETRAVLNRARLRSRASSTDSGTHSQPTSINFDHLRHSFRRPSRTISNLTSNDLQYLSREDDEKVKGPRVEVRHRARKVTSVSRERVDAVMKAPPHMRGGLVVIRSFCR